MLLKNLLMTLYDTTVQIYDPWGEILFSEDCKKPENLIEYLDFPVKKVSTTKTTYNIPAITIYL